MISVLLSFLAIVLQVCSWKRESYAFLNAAIGCLWFALLAKDSGY